MDCSEFLQLLVNKFFCCMGLYGDLMSKARFTLFGDPNILSASFADLSDYIYEYKDYR